MINDNEHKAENEKQIIQIQHIETYRPKPRHGDKYTKSRIVLCMMVISIKKHFS